MDPAIWNPKTLFYNCLGQEKSASLLFGARNTGSVIWSTKKMGFIYLKGKNTGSLLFRAKKIVSYSYLETEKAGSLLMEPQKLVNSYLEKEKKAIIAIWKFKKLAHGYFKPEKLPQSYLEQVNTVSQQFRAPKYWFPDIQSPKIMSYSYIET